MSSEALLQEGMSMLDEAMKMKDNGCAMTKAEAANATIQNARKALDDVQTAISSRDSQRKKKRKIKLARGFPQPAVASAQATSFVTL